MKKVYAGGAFAGLAAIVATWIALGVGSGDGGGSPGVTLCPFPKFPDATCTGVPAGVTLDLYTGPAVINTANTVIDGKLITADCGGCPIAETNGTLEIRASNVTVKNSRVEGSIFVPDDSRMAGKEPARIEDTEIYCDGTGGTAITEGHMIIRRVRIHGCENGMSITQEVDMRDSFIEYLLDLGGSEAHEDGVQFGCGHWDPTFTGESCAPGFARGVLNITFIHNTIFGMNADGTFGTSGIITNPNAIDTNVLIQGNLLAGGGYTLYCTGGKPPENPVDSPMVATNFRIIDNHFSMRFKPSVGSFGTSTNCFDETQSGNVIQETGAPTFLG